MKRAPMVSIAMPVYNGGDYFELALKSVLGQTYTDFEVIIVNDGSTDSGATDAIARKYASSDSRIKYISQENSGVAGALNKVLAHASGSYFSWLSHDDLFLPHKIESQLNYIDRLDIKDASIFSNYSLIDSDGNNITDVILDIRKFIDRPSLSLLTGSINGCTLLIPMDILKEHGPFRTDLRYTQDYDLWNKILSRHDFFLQPEVLVKYRIHPGQDTQKPGATLEGNALWSGFIDNRSGLEKAQIFGSQRRFYKEMASFLSRTPYAEAASKVKVASENTDLFENVLVSIIIPFFNEVDLVHRAVWSALRQTHSNIEVLLIDDGSTETLETLIELAKSEHRIHLFHQANQGAAAARNFGMQLATGEYVAFLDADDVFLPNKVEFQLKAMQEAGSKFSHTSYFVHYPERSTKRGIVPSGRFTGPVYPDIIAGCPIATPTVMLHSIVIGEGFRFPENCRIGEDVLLWTNIAQLHHLLGIDEPLSEVQWDQNTTAINIERGLKGLEALLARFKEDDINSKYPAQILALDRLHQELVAESVRSTTGIQTNVLLAMLGPDGASGADLPEDSTSSRGLVSTAAPQFALPDLWASQTSANTFLFVTHTWGGGIERHVADMTYLLRRVGVRVLRCQPMEGSAFAVTDPSNGDLVPIVFSTDGGSDQFTAFLGRIGVTHAHVHSLAGFSEASSDFFVMSFQRLGIPFDVTVHDYMAFCPTVSLTHPETGVYCGCSDIVDCERFVCRHGSRFGRPCVGEWRARFSRFLASARRIFVPSVDARLRFEAVFPGLPLRVRPHPERFFKRIVLMGTFGPHKGSEILLKTARVAHEQCLPLRFILIGASDRDAELRAVGNVDVTGVYEDADLEHKLRAIQADLAWFPSVCPETYSFVLSAALSLGIKCVSFDIGALAERIRLNGNGVVMPLNLMHNPQQMAYDLLEQCPDVERSYSPCSYDRVISDYYEMAE